jgi:superoxide dismutase, Fe-Mn family
MPVLERSAAPVVIDIRRIEEKLSELNYSNAPGFLVNGLKREQLIAMNSMILHELFFDGILGAEIRSRPGCVASFPGVSSIGSGDRACAHSFPP